MSKKPPYKPLSAHRPTVRERREWEDEFIPYTMKLKSFNRDVVAEPLPPSIQLAVWWLKWWMGSPLKRWWDSLMLRLGVRG